ncbi:GntR family transcriptional regulator [Xanthobacter autotrophicus]|uniref:GntR family transcriptional regulator n=1 Tax=Xanthobacter autotrophicus TaxID=280 RepID=UPI00372681C4
MSQSVNTLLRLRELILSGEMRPGERVSELSVSDRIGASRTPVRAALMRLADEGLLESLPGGGFAVRSFTERDIRDAIEVRGTLEGLAARIAAEQGVAEGTLADLRDTIARIDGLLGDDRGIEVTFAEYVVLNEQFHTLLAEAADSSIIAQSLGRAAALPFASPSGFLQAQSVLPEARLILTLAQEQHRAVVEAIANREGTRAEALMREHARLARRNLELALRDRAILQRIPGGALIRRRQRP